MTHGGGWAGRDGQQAMAGMPGAKDGANNAQEGEGEIRPHRYKEIKGAMEQCFVSCCTE
jgi:hypothetical protein